MGCSKSRGSVDILRTVRVGGYVYEGFFFIWRPVRFHSISCNFCCPDFCCPESGESHSRFEVRLLEDLAIGCGAIIASERLSYAEY